jgi:sulfonate dioxygenase
MAPSVAELKSQDTVTPTQDDLKPKPSGLSYPLYYPYHDSNEKFPPIQLFEHTDPGARANPAKPNLLTPNTTTRDISPYLGTEITGVQISQLNKEGLDELALLAAERKLLIFRDQDFKDLGPERQIEIARHFGPIHKHPTSGNVKGYPEFHVGKDDSLLLRLTLFFLESHLP